MGTTDARFYPRDLGERVTSAWPTHASKLPESLEYILDTAYHASFLREEERPISCRIVYATPAEVLTDDPPPSGLLSLEFESSRPFDEHELRRLSPAVKYHRSLIGIRMENGKLRTWGIVQTGPRWLQGAKGGRGGEPAMPPTLVVRIIRPGHIGVSCGYHPIAELRGGRLTDFTLDCFASRWLPDRFGAERSEIARQHVEDGGHVDTQEATELAKHVSQQMLKRVIATMRSAHHGGALVFLPPSCHVADTIIAKYAFQDAAPRRSFRRLLLSILDELGRRGAESGHPIGAELYRVAPGRTLVDLDEGLFEVSHLVAALADVDGAVLLTRRFEVLGFGAEIVGNLPVVDRVRRGLDVEASEWAWESTDAVGTRHRSAYRLCAAVPEALAIVVSQDGGVRFIANHNGDVTYWDHGVGDD